MNLSLAGLNYLFLGGGRREHTKKDFTLLVCL